MLQAAGLVAGTLPYASAGQVVPPGGSTSSNSGIDPTTGVAYSTELAAAQAGGSSVDIGAALSTTYAGLPLYLWLGGALGAYFILGRQGRR